MVVRLGVRASSLRTLFIFLVFLHALPSPLARVVERGVVVAAGIAIRSVAVVIARTLCARICIGRFGIGVGVGELQHHCGRRREEELRCG